MNLQEYERIQPNATVDGILFNLPNSHCEWRVKTMYTKEPDTVAWIRSMPAGDIFFDIGANIGLYTMLAWKQGLRVMAFEPEAQNFSVLIRNLAMNRVPKELAVAFPLCISDGETINTLRLSDLRPGGSCHSFGSDMNYKRQEKQWAYEQGSVAFSLDTLVFECGLPVPNHVKIDVDGFEDKCLKGMSRVLAHPSLKSVLVEMDSANSDHMGWKDGLEKLGFKTDDAQIAAARRSEGPFAGIGNIIFTRESVPVSEGVQPSLGSGVHPTEGGTLPETETL